MPIQAKGDSKTHHTQAAAPNSELILVIETAPHFGQRTLIGYIELLASEGYLPVSTSSRIYYS